MKVRMLVVLLLFGFCASVSAQTSVSGRVVFEGTPPVAEKVQVKSDVATCGAEQEMHQLILGNDKGVANAVVSIIGAPAAEGSLQPFMITLKKA